MLHATAKLSSTPGTKPSGNSSRPAAFANASPLLLLPLSLLLLLLLSLLLLLLLLSGLAVCGGWASAAFAASAKALMRGGS
jgi:hypothetical protein